MLGDLERGQAHSAVLTYGALLQVHSRHEHDDRGDGLAPLLVLASDDRSLKHPRARFKHRLDLARRDVLATADDRVRLATGDVQEAAIVDVTEIARVQASVCCA